MAVKTLKVTIIKKSGDKTVKGRAVRLKQHPIYKKYSKVYSYYMIHDENNSMKVGDEILIQESKPISKKKRWVIYKEKK
ncbi:uS17 family ribosomal protein [Pseudomonadota bacterium]